MITRTLADRMDWFERDISHTELGEVKKLPGPEGA